MAAAHDRLTPAEKAFLALPTAAGFVFGLLPLLVPSQFASVSGFPGNDTYVYRLAGAATLGYGVGLVLALREGRWLPVRPLVAAVLVFNIASLFACAVEIVQGTATWIVYLITAASVLFVAGTTLLLVRHGRPERVQPDLNPVFAVLLGLLSGVAVITGLLPLVIPVQYGHLFDLRATDVFLYRQAGAATLGYAFLGALLLMSRRRIDIRYGIVMALVFNAVAFIASVLCLVTGGGTWAPYLIGPASLFASAVGVLTLARRGR